jgi:hypothetical protein
MANNPSGFEYRDDSIVARLAVEVPASALTDMDQVRDRASAVRTEMEAIARATGDWSQYLQAIPQITEQANQAYRNMITSLERMSYIQNELGGGHPNVSISGAPSGGPKGGAQPYSTAAPAGYTDPFMGLPGQGMGMGMMGAQTYMQSMMMSDPRMFANMAAQRGYPVNPAQLGLVGGAVAAQQGAAPHTGGGMGQGANPPGAMTPQATQASRNSAAQPDPTNGGTPASSEPQRTPATPHPDTPAWQQMLNTVSATAGSVMNETRSGMSGRGGGLIAGGAAALSAIGRIGGNAGGGGGDDGGGTGGGVGGGSGSMGSWGRVAAGAGMAGIGLGVAAKGLGKIQDAGEQIQQYRNLGAESGGGAVEGAGFEIQARMMALNPFITLDQSRSIMQSALKNGYTGKEFDTVTGFMADNLKEMNMSSSQSMQIFQSIVEKGHGSVKDLYATMDELKDLTRLDGNKMGQTQRNQQFADLVSQFSSTGASGQFASRLAMSGNEAFSDNQVLKKAGSDAFGQGFASPTFAMMMATNAGIRGLSDPEELAEAMEEKGVDGGAAFDATMKKLAQNSTIKGNKRASVTQFHKMLNRMGITVERNQAKEMYEKYMAGESPYSTGADIKEARSKADPGTIGEQMDNTLGSIIKAPLNVMSAIGQGFGGNFGKAKDSLGAAERNFTDFTGQMGKYFTSADDVKTDIDQRVSQNHATVAQAQAAQSGSGTINTEGRVSGDIRITVDQAGRVSAPQVITLTGTQKSVNAGYGGGTMNNPPPGDYHQNTGFPGGG